MNLTPTTGTDLALGPFWGDPLKTLHLEGDSLGAVVYWCTGAGLPFNPLWYPAFRKLIDEIKKKLEQAKRVLQPAVEALARGLAALGRILLEALKFLLVLLLILAVAALVVLAIICFVLGPPTAGLAWICTAVGIGAAAGAVAAILLLLGLPTSNLSGATATLYRAVHPEATTGEAERGADYERDTSVAATSPITSTVAASTAVSAFDPPRIFWPR